MADEINNLPNRLAVMPNYKNLVVIGCIFSSLFVTAQSVIDSARVFSFPVRNGVIYQYDRKGTGICYSPTAVVTIMTHDDSVFYFKNAKVTGVFRIDSSYVVVFRNEMNEYVTYSNLRTVNVKKGDWVRWNQFIGFVQRDAYDETIINSLDIIIFQGLKDIGSVKTQEFILNKMCKSSGDGCSDFIGNSF